MADEPTPAPAPAPTPTPAPADKPWHDGFDADTLGYLQNRGLADKDAKTVAAEAIKAHRNAEKALGVPAERLIKLPADKTNPAEWDDVWKRLGKPKEATEYQLEKLGEDNTFVDGMRAALFENNIPKEAGEGVVKAVNKLFSDFFGNKAKADEAALAVEKGELAKNWGPNVKANEVIAERAATTLNVKVDDITSALGYKKGMEFLHTIGSKIGEDNFVNPNSGGVRITTREQAVSQIADLKADQGFVAKYRAGDIAAKKQMDDLHILAYGSAA